MEKIDILYTMNHNYLNIMLSSLLSIIKNGNIKKIHCHIITSSFQIEDYHKLNAFLKKYNNIEINCYPLEQFNIGKFQIPNWKGSQIANDMLFFESISGQKLT